MQADEPLAGVIRISQALDATGAPDPQSYTREVRYEGLRSATETVMDFLRPLSPRETAEPGVFSYTDPAQGSGTLRLDGFRTVTADEIQQAVRVLGLSAAIGQSEPVRQEVLSFGNAMANRTTNPYFKILFGSVVLLLMTIVVIRFSAAGFSSSGAVVAVVVAVIVGGLSIWLILNGFRRRAWWHRAREEARRQGVALPDQLKTWN